VILVEIMLAAAVVFLAALLWIVWPFVHAGIRLQPRTLTELEARDHTRPLSHAVDLIDTDTDDKDVAIAPAQ
jgi:hypothetical protein